MFVYRVGNFSNSPRNVSSPEVTEVLVPLNKDSETSGRVALLCAITVLHRFLRPLIATLYFYDPELSGVSGSSVPNLQVTGEVWELL